MRAWTLGRMAAVAAAAALGLAGCGGDDETTTTDAAPTDAGAAALSADAFARQANAICAAGSRTLQQAANSTFTGGQPSAAALQRYADFAVPSIQLQIEAIRALPAPEDLQDRVADFLDTAKSDVEKVKADPSLFAAGDTDPFANTNEAAAALALDQCESSG